MPFPICPDWVVIPQMISRSKLHHPSLDHGSWRLLRPCICTQLTRKILLDIWVIIQDIMKCYSKHLNKTIPLLLLAHFLFVKLVPFFFTCLNANI